MPVDEMFSDMDKIVNWAENYGCYTNSSTGLHMNISVPDMSTAKLDFVKLALLMGDEYVLEKFERMGNYFAKSAMQMVRDRVAQRPEDATAMLEQMKERLNALAWKVSILAIVSQVRILSLPPYIKIVPLGAIFVIWCDENSI